MGSKLVNLISSLAIVFGKHYLWDSSKWYTTVEVLFHNMLPTQCCYIAKMNQSIERSGKFKT